MARRIALPSADELFGDQPKPQRSTPRASAKTTAKPGKTVARRRSADRLTSLESHLSTMPVDALVDLRDGIEDLLSADQLDEPAVKRLLDSVGA